MVAVWDNFTVLFSWHTGSICLLKIDICSIYSWKQLNVR